VEFEERDGLRVLVVPIRLSNGGQATLSERWKTVPTFLRKVYPISQDDIVWTLRREVDASGLDLMTEAGQRELIRRLKSRQSFLCRISGGLLSCPNVILGILPDVPICDTSGTNCFPPGRFYHGYDVAIAKDVSNLALIAAHEIGHYLTLGDEYGRPPGYPNAGGGFLCLVNPPPALYCGRDGTGQTPPSPCFQCSDSQAQPWNPGAIDGRGSKVRAIEDEPFDVDAIKALGDRLSFMGSAGDQMENYWVTPAAYNHMFYHQRPATVQDSSVESTDRVAIISGWVGRTGDAHLYPAYYVTAASPSAFTGTYSIDVLDVHGQPLASQGFDVSFVVFSNPLQDIEKAPFDVAVRFPDGARTVRVRKGTQILTEVAVSPSAPDAAMVHPTGGETWTAGGNYTIRWQASDPDGGLLYYTVLYRQGTSDWIVLGADLTTNELTVDAAGLPGGNAAQVQVLATDGINTATAESGLFTVGRKGPEAFITYPAEGASFMPGVSFFLQGTAYDLEDGTLPDSAYRWTSNKDGDLGTGASNLVILSPSPHVITLTVTDSDGNTAVKTLRISAGSQQFMPLIYRSQ
jgi:hypothetical protein